MPNPVTKPEAATGPVGPPTKHQLALMVWLCVFPTLTLINLTWADWLRPMSPVLRTFVLVTIAVPVVIYGLMPQLHKVREAVGSKFRAMGTPPKPAELTAAYENMLKESYKFNGDLLAIGAPKGKERAFPDAIVDMQKVTETVEKQRQEAFFANEDTDPYAASIDTLATEFGPDGMPA